MITRRVQAILAVFAALLLYPAAADSAAINSAVKAPAPKAPTVKARATNALEPTYTVLNPEAPLAEIDTFALAPRLTTFAGKTILIYDMHGGYEKPMAGLAAQLKPLLPPDTKLVYYDKPDIIDANSGVPKGIAAVIAGHGF
jgi:hypothetical protein